MDRLLLIIFAIFLATLPLHADDDVAKGKFAVSFVAEDQQSQWRVRALEKNVYNDLAGYARVVPVVKSKDESRECPNRTSSCLLKLYQKLNLDALMLGEVSDSSIEYKVYDVRNGSLVKSSSVRVEVGVTMLKLRMAAFSAFKPFLEKGGILERRKYKASNSGELSQFSSSSATSYTTQYRIELLILFVTLICLPYLLTLFGKPRSNTERSSIVSRWFTPFLFTCLSVLGAQHAIEYLDIENISKYISPIYEKYQWVFSAFGGGSWGYFLIVNMKLVVPHLQGIERIKQNTIFPLIRAFFITLFIKLSIVTCFYIGFFYGVYSISQDFGVSQEATIILILPLSGLFIGYWIGLLLEVFAMSLDVKLVDGTLSYDSLTQIKVKKYFIGYLKRNGVTLNKKLVDDIVFIPGKNKGVICYGGGLSRPRIAIEKRLIDFAIEPDDERKLIKPKYRNSNAYRLQPNLREHRKTKKMFSMRNKKRERYLIKTVGYFDSNINLRQDRLNARTEYIKGIILPEIEAQDDLPSLMSDNLDDMQIVEALLLENAQAIEPYDEDAEIDDSSIDDKDFLFGILLHKFGGLLRHEHVFTTLYFYFRYKEGAKKRSYSFPFSRSFSTIADTFVVLNFGLHHLMQHLYFQVNSNVQYLTTRRRSNFILESQDTILTGVKKVVDERKKKLSRTDEYDRIIWLSKFCPHPLSEQKNQRLRYYFKWVFTLFVVSAITWVGLDSYQYHPIHIETIDNEKLIIREAIEKAKEDERKDK